MSSPPPADVDIDAGGTDPLTEEPRVLLFMRPGRDRELLLETLGERYRVETTTNVETFETEFDCCVFDTAEFNRVAGTLQARRDASDPVFLPFVLLMGESLTGHTTAEVWKYADDVIEMPVKKAELVARIRNLVERRRTAVKLNEREEQLERTVQDLQLKERAMDALPIGSASITADGEVRAVNPSFVAMVGGDTESDVLGRRVEELFGGSATPDQLPERLSAGGEMTEQRTMLSTLTGETVQVSVTGRLVDRCNRQYLDTDVRERT